MGVAWSSSPRLFLTAGSRTDPFHSSNRLIMAADLVLDANEVLGELLNGQTGVAGNGVLGMVTDEDGLSRLGNGDALPTLS